MTTVHEDILKDWGFTPVAEALPSAHRNCILITLETRLLGYLDEDQVWRDARNGEIKNVIAWHLLFP